MKVNLYWDNSNIFIGAKKAAFGKGEGYYQTTLRIQFDNLYALARAGRDLRSAVCVGSVPPELQHVWDRIRNLGVDIELYERGAESSEEQGVDQCLQVHMLRAALDLEPGVAVVLTGDGKGYESGSGFYADLERMHSRGWGIEVLSWDGSCKVAFKNWARQVGVYVPLEDFYESISFVQGGRSSKPISLTHRMLASPDLSRRK